MSHTCQDDLVLKVTQSDVPYFNAPIYLENKQQVGKIDEIFGTLRDYFVSVNLSDTVKAKSFEKDQTLYIDPAKLLPLKMFLPGGDKKTRWRPRRSWRGPRGWSGCTPWPRWIRWRSRWRTGRTPRPRGIWRRPGWRWIQRRPRSRLIMPLFLYTSHILHSVFCLL